MVTATDRIEDLRVAWERDLERVFVGQPFEARPSQPDPGERDPRVRLERAMAERVHRIADRAAGRLGCTDPFVLYQTPREHRLLSAQALLGETPFAVRLIGPVASALDDEALAALIGHEIGHWLALGHRAHPPSIVLQGWTRGAPRHLCRLGVVAAELTADRFSLVAAAGELEAAVRLEVASQTYDSPRALGVRELDYLADLRREVEAGHVPLLRQDGYPTPAFRLFATWLFWRSEIHRELTGVGPGELPLREVDVRLRSLCDESLARERASDPVAQHLAQSPAQGSERTERVAARTRRPGSSRQIPAGVRFEEGTRAVASSIASAVGKIVARVVGEPKSEPSSTEDDLAPIDIDDLEIRFRALEREEAARETTPKPPMVREDLETRFRELEGRERRK